VLGAFGNSGQICASVERVYAHKDIFDAFVKKVVRLTKNLRHADPLKNSSADIGAMTSEEQLHIVEDQLEDPIKKGAHVLTGGKRSGMGKMYFEPAVLTNIAEDMEALLEETFGPLLPIIKVDNEKEAVRRANDSLYGLSAYVFTRNTKR
jgi:acyl-CoA reductase-like NAD-dependent aldehyde dehydrogenase